MRAFLCIVCTVFCFSSPLLRAQVFVGIAGGTGSGKTTLAAKIVEYFGDGAVLIQQDSYYKDLSLLSPEEREGVNFDHPGSLDFSLMREHLLALKDSQSVFKPVYDFVSHTRKEKPELVEPKEVIVVEGILLFATPEVRDLFDLKVFIETDNDIRILRRLERDLSERGRQFESVKKQYLTTVKPMHVKYVEPSKTFADIIIYGINENFPIITKLISGYLEKDVLAGNAFATGEGQR